MTTTCTRPVVTGRDHRRGHDPRPSPSVRAASPAWAALLSEREKEVLRCVARGQSNAEIARELFISLATVKTHVGRLLVKIGVRDRVQLVVAAYRTGFINT